MEDTKPLAIYTKNGHLIFVSKIVGIRREWDSYKNAYRYYLLVEGCDDNKLEIDSDDFSRLTVCLKIINRF